MEHEVVCLSGMDGFLMIRLSFLNPSPQITKDIFSMSY